MSDDKYVIWGSAGTAKVIASTLELIGGSVIALFDNRDTQSVLPGIPIFIGESGLKKWVASQSIDDQIKGIVAIGGHRGRDRLLIQELFKKYGLKIAITLHPTASICPTATLGEGTQVFAQALIAAGVMIGAAGLINHRASVDHECILGNGVHVAPGAVLCGCVTVGDYVMIGAGSVVLPKLSIGSGAIVGAGAVVTCDVPQGAVVVGNPARPIKKGLGV